MKRFFTLRSLLLSAFLGFGLLVSALQVVLVFRHSLQETMDELEGTTAGQAWLRSTGIDAMLPQATHLVWTTGGLLVPDAQYQGFVQRGRAVLAAQA